MKALKFFIWTLNLLLLAYLGFTFSGTALMKRKDVTQIEAGNKLMISLNHIEDIRNKKLVEERQKVVEREGNRPSDTHYFDLARLSLNQTKILKKQLADLKYINKENINIINSLLVNYENKVLLDTAAKKQLQGFSAVNIDIAIGSFPLIQEAHRICLQNLIERVNSKILEILSKKTTVIDVRFDKTIAMAVPKESIITEGEEYHADLLLVNTDFYIYHVDATLDSQPLFPKEGECYYPISFPATADHFDENGECRKKWTAEITIANAFKDTTYFIEREYIIKRKK